MSPCWITIAMGICLAVLGSTGGAKPLEEELSEARTYEGIQSARGEDVVVG